VLGVADFTEYELTWPRQLFAAELRALLADTGGDRWVDRVQLLLAEAFIDGTPLEDFNAIGFAGFGLTVPSGQSSQWQFATQLLVAAPTLREYSAPQPYWPAREGRQVTAAPRDRIQLRQDFSALVTRMQHEGYLDRALPDPCVDDSDAVEADPGAEVAHRLGIPDLWPLQPDSWDDDTFYGLIEVFHDLVARPRNRSWHDYGGCGWHYSGYATAPGRALYRWRVDQLLAEGGIPMRLADSGEDAGRLVHQPGDSRMDLVTAALATPARSDRNTVEHAVALFRSRSAGREDKRSACRAMAGLLEDRRKLIKQELLSRDEGALFEIANKFAVRHRNADQRDHYDDAYLDWLFWYYLATFELTDRLLARQAGPG